MMRDTAAPEIAPPPADAAAGCVVCEGLRSENGFLADADRPEAIAGAAEAVVDALGFCGYHGALLAARAGTHVALAQTLCAASDRVIELFTEQKRNAERLFEIFFSADRACAMCKVDDHRLAGQIHRVCSQSGRAPPSVRSCFPHYRDLIHAVKAPALPALASAQRELLETVVAAIGPIAHEPHARTTHSAVANETLHWALGVVAGDAGPARERSGMASSGDDTTCPVCAEIARAEERWTEAVRAAARLGQDLWTVFPTCPTHVGRCARLGDERVAVLAARYAADAELTALRRGTEALARDNDARAAAMSSVFYRRKSSAYVLGQQRKMIADVPRCPACERLTVAQTRGIGRQVQHLRDARHRDVRHRADALCLKHFAAVYVLAPQGDAWGLVTMQTEQLRRHRTRLAQSCASSDPTAVHSAVGEAIRVWSAA